MLAAGNPPRAGAGMSPLVERAESEGGAELLRCDQARNARPFNPIAHPPERLESAIIDLWRRQGATLPAVGGGCGRHISALTSKAASEAREDA